MKKSYFLILSILAMLLDVGVVAQSEATSPRMSFNIVKEVKPPLWEVVEAPYFVDADGNHAVDAMEECKIVMKLKNVGTGDGTGLTARIVASGRTSGISVSNKKIPNIPVGGTATVEFPISTNMNTSEGIASFEVYVGEPLGFNTDKYTVKVKTHAFQAPRIEVKDYVVTCDGGGKLEKMKPFQVQILIQNTQYGLGEDITVSLKYPGNVYNMGGQDMMTIPQLSAGESKTLTYSLLVNNLYDRDTLPLQVLVNEKYGKYAQNKTLNLELNQHLANRSIEVDSKSAPKIAIVDAQLRSEVDRNIPETGKKNSHRYALVIGNKDYHSYQKGLESEQDVPYADEDAIVFKQYCIKTLGVEEKNIVLLINATEATMNQEIEYITSLAKLDSQAEIIFYYSGHGFPNESTKEPYLIPVDVNAVRLKSAISLCDLYNNLSLSGAKRITVFLDACFTGKGRAEGLLVSKGIGVTPKKCQFTGNLVVFSATDSFQRAFPYNEKNHGMFTYFLLKILQDSNGECLYSELYDYLKKNVMECSLRVNRETQIPKVTTSLQVQESWGNWRF